jgi:FkbM family methyltransferase
MDADYPRPGRDQLRPGLLEPLVVYGLGAVGEKIVDDLTAHGVQIDLILDRGRSGQTYRGIPVSSLDQCADGRLAGRPVMIGLHNHYVDVNQLYGDLRSAGAGTVLTPANLRQLVPDTAIRPGYWLDLDFDYEAHEEDFGRLAGLLADERSRQVLDAILRYRASGDLAHCPEPSLADEYTPLDIPRYAGPLKLIDCGAFTGVAIHKFLKAGYDVESFVAFEPDPANFDKLAGRDFPVRRRLCLPLGTWSKTTQFKFASDSTMGSCLSDEGNVTVQCVAVDDVVAGEEVNLVKLDVEGAEIETLRGMERLIRDQRPNLLLSVYHTPGHLYEIADLVHGWNLDYRFHMRVHEFNTFGIVLYCLRDELLERPSTN